MRGSPPPAVAPPPAAPAPPGPPRAPGAVADAAAEEGASRGRIAVTAGGIRVLWLGGVVAAAVAAVRLLAGGESLATLWAQHLLLGAVVPASLVAVTLVEARGRGLALRRLELLLGLACVAGVAPFLLSRGSLLIVVLAAVHLGVVWALERDRLPRPWPPRRDLVAPLVPPLFVALASWTAAVQLVWWRGWEGLLLGTPHSALVLVAALAAVALSVHSRPRARTAGTTGRKPFPRGLVSPWSVGTAAGLALLTLLSARADGLFDYSAFHHWSFFVGPAELVRQGHWLLWDVPSQYGFLDVAAIVVLPAHDAWQSLFLLDVAANLACAAVLFLALRTLGSGVVNLVVALAVTVTAQLIRYFPPYTHFIGPQQFPNTGGFRFLWLILLMGLVLAMPFDEDAGLVRCRRWFAAGTALWLLGVLWSFESAVYCSAVWAPLCGLLAVRTALRGGPERLSRRALARAARWGLLPLGALAGAVLVITLYYLARMGHPPDLRAYTEFASSYQAGFYTYPFDPFGAVWALLAILLALTIAAAGWGPRAPLSVVAPLSAALAGLWAAGSYFAIHTHPLIVWELAPVAVMAAATVLHLLRRHPPAGTWRHLVSIAIVPVLTLLVAGTLAEGAAARSYAAGPDLGLRRVSLRLPHLAQLDPRLPALLQAAGVAPGDPIAFVDCSPFPSLMPRWDGPDGSPVTSVGDWLPAHPLGELMPLSPGRRATYLERFLSAGGGSSGGWIVECTSTAAQVDWLHRALDRDFTVTGERRQAPWRVARYAPRTAS